MYLSYKSSWRYLSLIIVSVALSLTIGRATVRLNLQQDKNEGKTDVVQPPLTQNGARRSKASGATKEDRTVSRKSGTDSQASKYSKSDQPASPREKKKRAMSLLDGVLATAHRIEP